MEREVRGGRSEMTNETNLLPCPFCHGEVTHDQMMDGAMSYQCDGCGLNARFPDDVFGYGSDPDKTWNRRYTEDDLR